MKRSTMLGAAAGLVAGVSLTTLALAAPSYALLGGGSSASVPAAASLVAPIAGQVVAPVAGQITRWGSLPNLADLVEKVSPSVVKIEVRAPNPNKSSGQGGGDNPLAGTPFEDFFRGLPNQGQGEQRDMRGSGSGFVVRGGYIVTNNHVVDHAKKMTVILNDGRELQASLVGTDEKTDLAVIKVDGSGLPAALSWGDSNRARPGDNVFAMGAPFGLGNTVTAGIVSARGRDIGGPFDDYIQVDAPINQGNSGGPLFDQSGAVIGVNSAIYSPTGGNVGIGFSIPSELAQNIVQQIVSHGSVERGWLGVQIQPVTPDIASSLNLASAKGALVGGVTDGSPAAKAGLKERDVIVSFGGRDINHLQDLTRAVADTKAGSTKDVRIVRDGRQQTIPVRIAELKPDDKEAKLADNSSNSSSSVSPASANLADLGLSVAANDEGIFVTNVKVNSPAEDAGVQRGDRLVMINQTEVKSTEAARKAVEDAKRQKRNAVLLQLERNGQRSFVGVPFSDS